MNFFGHAWLASESRAEPAFVLGAMAPDLYAMARRRPEARAAVRRAVAHVEAATAGAFDRGVAFHLASDEAFHAAPSFGALLRASMAWLTRAGVRRGPARAVAHVGLELLLDGWLARDGVPAAYREALSEETRRDASGLADVCRRLADSPLPEAYADPAEVARRLTDILARRPRLALAPHEREPVGTWARKAVPRIDACAPDLLRELRTNLARGRFFQPEARPLSDANRGP